jgi:hypothetical protein
LSTKINNKLTGNKVSYATTGDLGENDYYNASTIRSNFAAKDNATLTGTTTVNELKLGSNAALTGTSGSDALSGSGSASTIATTKSVMSTLADYTVKTVDTDVFKNTNGEITIKSGGVTNSMLAANSVDTDQIKANAVTTSEILDNTITNADIAATAGI